MGFKGWSTDCSGLDAEEECNLCASINSGVVGSERHGLVYSASPATFHSATAQVCERSGGIHPGAG